MEPVFGLVILVLGIGAGFFIGRTANTAAKQAAQLSVELAAARDELARHRQQVNEHFTRTGELVTAMTENYRAVYEHLAKGARSLCTGEAARVTMAMPPEKLPGAAAITPDTDAAHPRVEPARPANDANTAVRLTSVR